VNWAVWGRKLSSTVLREENFYKLIYPDRGEQAIRQGDPEIAEAWFDQAAEYWKQAIALAPSNYIEAQNWLKITGRFGEWRSLDYHTGKLWNLFRINKCFILFERISSSYCIVIIEKHFENITKNTLYGSLMKRIFSIWINPVRRRIY